MKFAHLLAALTLEPLYLTPEKARVIIRLVEQRASGIADGRLEDRPVSGNALTAHAEPGAVRYDAFDEDDEDAPPPPLYVVVNGVAVITVQGVISKRISGMAARCGGYDLDTLSMALGMVMADGNVSAVLLDINSPGGTGIGLPEVATLISRVRDIKPVIAFTDMQMCSAAYWLGAACDEVYCTPSAMVGSIGAYLACEDDSEAWKMAGRERLLFNGNATYKGMGIDGKAWSPEEKTFMQTRSEKATAAIRAAAQANRVLALEDMQGQVFDGTDALARNLVDGLVNSRDELLSMLAL